MGGAAHCAAALSRFICSFTFDRDIAVRRLFGTYRYNWDELETLSFLSASRKVHLKLRFAGSREYKMAISAREIELLQKWLEQNGIDVPRPDESCQPQ